MRVMILEDDPFIALDLRVIVESEGHEVVAMSDSLAEARAQLESVFDFAFLDIDVADGKSFEFAATLLDRRIPFAFVSASRPNDVPVPLRGASFIPKPFEERAIRYWMSSRCGEMCCH